MTNVPNNPNDPNANAQLIFGYTRQQLLQILGVIMTLVGTIATSTGWLTAMEVSKLTADITNAATALLGAAGVILTIWQSRKAASVAAASQVPGVQVHVNTSPNTPAPAAVVNLVKSKDPSVQDVVPMGPITSEPHEIKKPAVAGVEIEGKRV